MKQLVLRGLEKKKRKRRKRRGRGGGGGAGGRRLARVPHRKRRRHSKRNPVHVTLRARGGWPSFRCERVRAIFLRIFAQKRSAEFHVAHWSIQSNHIHLIVETNTKETLSAAMRGVAIRFAKRLAAMLALRKGKVWDDRYHAHELSSPRATRNALVYVLQNAKKHGVIAAAAEAVDLFSSGEAFDGWAGRAPPPSDHARDPPRTWMLRVGWRRHGLIPPSVAPKLAM